MKINILLLNHKIRKNNIVLNKITYSKFENRNYLSLTVEFDQFASLSFVKYAKGSA